MKKLLTVLFLTASLFFISCNNSGTTETKSDSTDSTRGDKPSDTSASKMSSTPPSQESIDFATKAADGGMMEVELGQIAQQNAKSQRVKDFGSMMVTDHSKANDELKSLAAANSVTLPATLSPGHKQHVDMMKKMTGTDFDKHYMDMMVNDHKGDIGEFQKEANSQTNDAFKSFAAKTLPTLQKHLDSAQAIYGKQ